VCHDDNGNGKDDNVEQWIVQNIHGNDDDDDKDDDVE